MHPPEKEKPIHHKNTRRKFGHDYRSPWKYHITITKAPSCEPFSSLEVKELTINGVSTKNTLLGQIIWRAIRDMQQSSIKIYQYAIMPDHIHMLIHVTDRLMDHLGDYIARFKAGITSEWQRRKNNPKLAIFCENYNDRIILPEHSLDEVYQYIRQNPYRLAVRKASPDFFRRQRYIFVNNREIQAYGNLFLLRNPFKISLVIHRADTEEIFNKKMEECLYYATNGGVVVSPFISPREKHIRKEIEAVGGRIILIHSRPFPDRHKPARHNFNQCSSGNLLLISPIDYLSLPVTDHPSYSQCHDMNDLAALIANPESKIT